MNIKLVLELLRAKQIGLMVKKKPKEGWALTCRPPPPKYEYVQRFFVFLHPSLSRSAKKLEALYARYDMKTFFSLICRALLIQGTLKEQPSRLEDL